MKKHIAAFLLLEDIGREVGKRNSRKRGMGRDFLRGEAMKRKSREPSHQKTRAGTYISFRKKTTDPRRKIEASARRYGMPGTPATPR